MRNNLNGEYVPHLLSCPLQVSRVPKAIHLCQSTREPVGAVADSPCHIPQKVSGGQLRVERLFHFFGIDCYLTSGAPQDGANLIGEKERLAFFEDSLRQASHIIPVECFGHGLTYRLVG